MHPLAGIAAESAECAGAAGLFWDMHDALFEHQSILGVQTIFMIADGLGLPESVLRNALKTGQYRTKVRNDFMGGVRSGVNGTPAFFINGMRHDGAYDFLRSHPPFNCALPPKATSRWTASDNGQRGSRQL